jgi:LAO/AO transport system kinase
VSSDNAARENIKRPEWTPEDGGAEFASRVLDGVSAGTAGGVNPPAPPVVPKRRDLSPEDYVKGILAGERSVLSRAITLVESNSPKHFDMARAVVREILPRAGNSVRVGITGVPGAGKSTFIDAFGSRLCKEGHRVAVLAVDPSSSVTRGSILGDKTRMENLSREKNAFIRPSPSGGTLGGVTRKSRETLMLCEAAGYDVILVETVGVGQSEATVRSMVDFFLLMVITGAGDELQGIKKGVMELADAILINKADGNNVLKANATRAEYDRILHYLRPATEGWETKAHTCSAVTGDGIGEIWGVVEKFVETARRSGALEGRRRQQTLSWVYSMVEEHIKEQFYRCEAVTRGRPEIEREVIAGALPATEAASELLRLYESS